MFTYNIVSYINRIKHEPQTLGELFRDLECELETLAISMQLFIQILTKISEIQNVVKDNKDFLLFLSQTRVLDLYSLVQYSISFYKFLKSLYLKYLYLLI